MFADIPVSWLAFIFSEQCKERTTLYDKLDMGHVKGHSCSSDKKNKSF